MTYRDMRDKTGWGYFKHSIDNKLDLLCTTMLILGYITPVVNIVLLLIHALFNLLERRL